MYYIALREGGEAKAELYRSTLDKYPIAMVEANKDLTIQAAKYKAFHELLRECICCCTDQTSQGGNCHWR
jgi:hypothetical protein